MTSFKTHTHIFNVPCVPDAVITNFGFPSFWGRVARHLIKQALVRKTMLSIKILDLMGTYNQVYTDIRYALAYSDANQVILDHIRKDCRFASRDLFGKGFFLTEAKMKKHQLIEKYKTEYDEFVMPLKETNSSAFLTSSFYTP